MSPVRSARSMAIFIWKRETSRNASSPGKLRGQTQPRNSRGGNRGNKSTIASSVLAGGGRHGACPLQNHENTNGRPTTTLKRLTGVGVQAAYLFPERMIEEP